MSYKILLPTDFSEDATNAIHYAINLFKGREAEFILLNCYSTNDDEVEYASGPATTAEESQQNLNNLAHELGLSADASHKFISLSLAGNVEANIAREVEDRSIDLIVMGSRGANKERKRAFGSNARDVMENLDTAPVLTVPGKHVFNGVDQIVFPTDYETNFTSGLLAPIDVISSLHKSQIIALHMGKVSGLSKREEENRKQLKEQFSDDRVRYKWLPEKGLQQGIKAYVDEHHSDLIAFVRKDHSFFGKLFSHPLVEDMLKHSDLPILVLHE